MTILNKRAIILEDDKGVERFLTEALNQYGYKTFHFNTPAVCPLQLYPKCRCSENERCADIIICDLDMPLIDGLTFIENQKIKGCKAPYIAMMSDAWSEETINRAKKAGCRIFFKPTGLAEIFNWLDEVENTINLDRKLFNWFNESTEKAPVSS